MEDRSQQTKSWSYCCQTRYASLILPNSLSLSLRNSGGAKSFLKMNCGSPCPLHAAKTC